jgi:coiled-coil domain-containing protein 55
MPALAFGLKAARASSSVSKSPQKRKAVFGDDEQINDEEPTAPAFQTGFKKLAKPLKPLNPLQDPEEDDTLDPRRHKSPKLSGSSIARGNGATDKYTNLSALRSAKLHDQQASQLDSSVYDYDGVYDTFQPSKQNNATSTNGEVEGPKYMTSLLTSAEQRKRDQLRAKEKLIQREREQEGEEFADKEKFVTGAYKRQQEEMRVLEEEERRKAEEEEERRRRGGGMTEWNRKVLERDEERMKGIREEEERRKKEGGEKGEEPGVGIEGEDEVDESKMAREMNEKGGRIVVNDEGELVDKRQLLSAGLNVAPKKPGLGVQQTKSKETSRPQEYYKSGQARNAREAQRERQSRMVERQIEEMAAKQQEAAEEDEKVQEQKNKSKITETEKMSAKERYLQRKREREEEARKAKEAKGG